MGGEIIHEIRIFGVCFAFPAMRMELWGPAAVAGVCISQGAWTRACSGQSDRDAPSGMLPLTQDGASRVFWALKVRALMKLRVVLGQGTHTETSPGPGELLLYQANSKVLFESSLQQYLF